MDSNDELNKSTALPLSQTMAGLARQMSALAEQLLINEVYDKAGVDNIYTLMRTISKLEELIDAQKKSTPDEAEDNFSIPDLLNLIEDRIHALAEQRAESIAADRSNAVQIKNHFNQ